MKRTKNRKLKRTKMSKTKNKTSKGREILIANVISYHKHLKDVVMNWEDIKLLRWVHPNDKTKLAEGVGINLNWY